MLDAYGVKLKYLVTGTGRSGTVYLARLLTLLGIPCGHESVFDNANEHIKRLKSPKHLKLSYCSTHDVKKGHAPIDWVNVQTIEAESSYLMVPYLSVLPKVPLIHVVRHPFKVINSFLFNLRYFNSKSKAIDKNDWQRRIYDFLPELDEIPTALERACYFYIKWNQTVEAEALRRPYLFCNVENIQENKAFFEFINKPMTKVDLPDDVNSFGKRSRNINVDEIPTGNIIDEFVQIVEKYGYSSNS